MKSFKFVDLFAGIGGMKIAFERAGGRCVMTSEIDKMALATYQANAKLSTRSHKYAGDITKILDADIPEHDVLVGGFPCQPYSMAGLRKGLTDLRGQLFMDILRFIRVAKPRAILLENVKGLVGHDSGKTFEFMLNEIHKQGAYALHWKVLNSMTASNVPQNRERVFIVGIRKDQREPEHFKFPGPVPLTLSIKDILQPNAEVDERYFYDYRYNCFDKIQKAVVEENVVYQWRRQYVRANKSVVSPTLTANMGGGSHNVPLVLVDGRIRKLTPRECARLQGFPDDFVLPEIADSHLYKQFGNSVTVPLIERLAKELVSHLNA